MYYLLILISLWSTIAQGLDNGLALTPPMGWLSWARFTCTIDCEKYPSDCINEQLYMDMADRLVADGFKDLGYEYVNIDDCWMENSRDENGRLVPDHKRFPNGIKGLADYVHSKGLKLGIYQDIGVKTCAGYPGSQGHFEIDAATFADWEVDMLKVDGCFTNPEDIDSGYLAYGEALKKVKRPILYSCEWPLYQLQAKIVTNYTQIAQHCNMWRNYFDVEDSWASILNIVDFYTKNQDQLVAAAGPGQWNDPDMILAGNFGLSYDEAKAQFALWAVMASPLLMSNDLRNLGDEYKALLQNKEIIAVNQDKLGKMGRQIYKKDNIEIWSRPISPVSVEGKYSYAIVFFNRNTLGSPIKFSIQLDAIIYNPSCYTTYDVFNNEESQTYCSNDMLTVSINPSGVTMIKAIIK